MMMKSAALTFVLLFSIPANGDVTFTLDELIKLKEEAEQHVSEPPDFMAAFDQYYQDVEGGDGRELEEGAEGSCGNFHDKCGPELTCMRFGFQHKCVPVDCLVNLGLQYRNTTFTNMFYEQIFEKAGVTPEEVGLAFAERDEYRDDPSALFGFDNPWKRFATVFHNNAPDFTEMLAKTNECMAKAPSVEGVTPMIGFTYGIGALVKLDWAFFWGIGSGDINIEDGTSFIPSTVYEISLAGLLGAHIHVSASFGWTFTGTVQDIPGDSLVFALQTSTLVGPNFAVKQTCDFPGQVPGVILDAGGGAGLGLSLGWTRSWMIINGTKLAPTLAPSSAPSKVPTVTA